MQRLTTTVVAVVGDAAAGALEALSGAQNVRVVPTSGEPLDTWAAARRTRSPFCAIGDDPLGEVAEAWTALFADRRATGRLEVAVDQTRGRIRAGAVDLPDVYVVAGDSPFHLAALQPACPHRVVPVGDDVHRTVSRLRAGRWWPAADALLADLDRRLPDAFAAPSTADADGAALLRS